MQSPTGRDITRISLEMSEHQALSRVSLATGVPVDAITRIHQMEGEELLKQTMKVDYRRIEQRALQHTLTALCPRGMDKSILNDQTHPYYWMLRPDYRGAIKSQMVEDPMRDACLWVADRGREVPIKVEIIKPNAEKIVGMSVIRPIP